MNLLSDLSQQSLYFTGRKPVINYVSYYTFANYVSLNLHQLLPNGHMFVDSLSVRHRNSTSKVCQYFIDYERRIQVKRMTSIRRGQLYVDSTFKIDEILIVLHVAFSCCF